MTDQHIVKSYDDELDRLHRLVGEMGGMVEEQLAKALDALVRYDPKAARTVIDRDSVINDYEAEIHVRTTELLALRQPMAEDLRTIVAALTLAANLERMGDYAKNIARRTISLTDVPLLAPTMQSLRRMGEIVQEMIKDVLDAYSNRDLNLANAVIRRDEDVDSMYESLFGEFLDLMSAEPSHIAAGTHLILVARDVERMGDHATNVAEKVQYILHGASGAAANTNTGR
jgi:phosphate transport system protein